MFKTFNLTEKGIRREYESWIKHYDPSSQKYCQKTYRIYRDTEPW